MTEKTNDTSRAEAHGAFAEQAAVSSTGRAVSSPFDNPTQQLPAVELGKELPRTDEELGLDPQVPSVVSQPEPTQPRTVESPAVPAADTEPSYPYASIPPAPTTPDSKRLRRRNGDNRRGTLDFGLFVLRLVVGGTFVYHGLQKLTGWFHGPGLDGVRQMMESGGWSQPTLATVMVIVGEIGGGVLLALGLASPLAAGAVLAVILDAWAWKQGMEPGFQYNSGTPTGVELESILAGAAAALILTGPGRWSLDRNRGWASRPSWGSFVVLLLAIAAAVATWYFLHGGNPLHGIGPFH
ncbi:DoxX family protein [Nocardia panacis]|uniref:DoxX family protein n=1 Tax=Nocardia panacis TaxID=2340916 RepID=A0A3A4KZP5_9NOCA|nr:DoxX family protein [Nocardia panacis]RJO74997.1 DoxX family protein [Nocardia panacis]